MYLSVNNRNISGSILSKREILGIIMVFSFVLYLLFPKKNIDQILEGKGKNTNLSINYLESMLLYYPDNKKLKMILIENYTRAKKNTKALALVNQLIPSTKDKKLLKKLYKTQYLLMKDLYFETDNQYLLRGVKEKLFKYFLFTKGDRDYTFFFIESAQLDFQKLKYVSMKGFLKERPEMVTYPLEKEAFTQALALDFKEDAYNYLLNLLNYKEVEPEIENYALSLMLERKEYSKVEKLATKFFLKSVTREEQIRYFNIALGAIIHEASSDYRERILSLISLYQSRIPLESSDIVFLIKALLQVGDIKEASRFSIVAFKKYPDKFNQEVTKEAIKTLTYNQELAPALAISLFAKDKFKSIEWLDKSIQLSLWQGKMREIVALNIEGYRHYKNPKYERYLLKSCNMNSAYEILGEIYTNKLEHGDYSVIKKVAEYYEYTGEIDKGESYFTALFQKVKRQDIHKQAILFSFKNSHYKKGLELYSRYRELYGMDKALQEQSVQKLIALKRFKEAYGFAKELKEDRRLSDLGWLQKDYKYIQKTLWKKERANHLKYAQYDRLIRLDSALNGGKELEYLYKKLWTKTRKKSYLTALFYLYLDKKELTKIKTLLSTLEPKERAYIEQNVHYQIAMANYFMQQEDISSAMRSFKKALDINQTDASTHQAYLWFLLDNELISPLKKELTLLKRNYKLQKEVGFPSVVTALKLQQGDLALRWLTPLLKTSDQIEYQVIYADLLEFQDRAQGAKSVRLKLFKSLNKKIKNNPKLLQDREFARVYLGLMMRYATPYAKQTLYFKKFKSLFSEEEFMQIEIGKHTYRGNSAMVRYLANKNRLNIPWLNLYLAMSLDNNQEKQHLLEKYSDTLPLKDKIIASVDIGDRAGAYSMLFQGLEDNRRDMGLFTMYHNMINSDYPKALFSSSYKHLTPQISGVEHQLSYRWHIYKGVSSTLSLHHHEYQQKGDKNLKDNSLSLALRDSNKRFSWDLSLSRHDTQNDFTSASLELKYHLNKFELMLKSKYQNPTTQTPQLQAEGMESGMEIGLKTLLSPRIQVAINYKQSEFKYQNRDKVGSGEQLQLSADYMLRSGYPDIKFNAYLNQNSYKNSIGDHFLPKDFIEFGSQLSLGASSRDTLHRSWKPFGTLGFAINNHHDIGSSLSLGLSGVLKGEDILEVMLDYSKGVDTITSPYYGFHLNYQF